LVVAAICMAGAASIKLRAFGACLFILGMSGVFLSSMKIRWFDGSSGAFPRFLGAVLALSGVLAGIGYIYFHDIYRMEPWKPLARQDFWCAGFSAVCAAMLVIIIVRQKRAI